MDRVGRVFAFACGRRSKWLVLALWVAALAVAGPMAGKLTGAENNDASTWLPGSAESTAVINLEKRFQPDNMVPALVVYERTSGITPADRNAVGQDIRRFAAVDGVTGRVAGPIPSADHQALQVVVPITVGKNGWDQIGGVVDQLHGIAGGGDGLSVHITGPGGYAAASADAFKGIDGTLLYAALGVVIVMLLLTYRSPVLWLFPVLSAGGALLAAQGLIYLLATHSGLTVNAQSAGILTVLVFGAGTDYALLLVARYREELRRHADRHEAMALALRRAGPAILASAATVAVGMLCLLVAELNSTRGLGPVAAIGVGVGLLAMLTLLPALLVVMGRWVFWPVRPSHGSVEPTQRGLWARAGVRIARRPRVVWIATVLILVGLAAGVSDLRASGLSNADSLLGKPDAVAGEQVLARHFPAGSGQPIEVISNAGQVGQVRAALAGTDGIVDTTEPVTRGNLTLLEGTSADAPDSAAGQATVDRVRAAVHRIPGADAKVGGATAIVLDTSRAASHDSHLIIPLVLLVVLVILGLLLRAVVAPLVLIATVVLSFGAALGVSTEIFHHVFGFAGEDTSFPLFVFVFLVALGIDYNIFLMTRVREEAERRGTRPGALIGLGATGGVITSAGLVLAGTFAVLATLPLVAFAEIGFAVALGVLLDTLVVRSVLVTALNLEIGRWMWWPHRLARVPDRVEVPEHEAEPALAR
ncbi:MAG TPA: MMPL family transporter [Mycobacteriales bacterium]|nr:MMPL family transporter [Mycobacteriales bacterium]